MKSMKVNRVFDSLKRKPTAAEGAGGPKVENPEVVAAQAVRSFCESAGPHGSGEEVLYLPTIVETAESTPSAAKECAIVIRKYLGRDDYTRPRVQYNAIMLIRILADNPGKTFTKCIDSKFVQAVRDLLRFGRDPSVKQLLIETLNTFQRERASDEGLVMLLDMWRKELERMRKQIAKPAPAPAFNPSQNYFSRNHHSTSLPSPGELSSRIEEAQTSAKLLTQLVQSTPPSEFLYNELVREFADRCQSASRSIQAYMVAENPSPDNDTMETLLETNEQLTKAISQHQRAILNARKIRGVGNDSSTSGTTPPPRTDSGFAAPPPGPPPAASNTSKQARKAVPIPPPGEYIPNISDDEEEPADPFADPVNGETAVKRNNIPFAGDRPPIAMGQFNDNLGVEPYHPGFKESKKVGESSAAKEHDGAPSDEDEENVSISPASPDVSRRRPSHTATSASNGSDSLYRY